MSCTLIVDVLWQFLLEEDKKMCGLFWFCFPMASFLNCSIITDPSLSQEVENCVYLD